MSEPINYRAVVESLRPTSEYHYRGSQRDVETGEPIPDTYASIGEWRDAETSKPTEAEIAAAWPTIQKRIVADELRQAKLINAISNGLTHNSKTYSLTPESLANWRDMAVTLRAEIDEAETTRDDTVHIQTATDEQVELTAGECLELLAKIGKTARLLQTRDMGWQAEIEAATTVAQLDAIIAEIEGV